MKKIIIIAILLVLSVSAYAEDSVLGKWVDKSNPIFYYEFKKEMILFSPIDGITRERLELV